MNLRRHQVRKLLAINPFTSELASITEITNLNKITNSNIQNIYLNKLFLLTEYLNTGMFKLY